MIPFVDLKAQYQSIKAEIDGAISETVESTSFIKGPRLAAFEEAFAGFCQVAHAVGASSGTTAITLVLRALGVGPGDEVICPSHTFMASAEPIWEVGATIVFADIDPDTYVIDPGSVADCMSEKTRVIMPVHIYGQMADMTALGALAADGEGDIAVLEDAAQAHGARQNNRMSGSAGDAACFSFYPGKNLGAYGDAGMAMTADPELAELMRKLGDHGRQDKYLHEIPGFNYRMDPLQAAVLSVKLKHLEGWNENRRAAAARYDALLAGVPGVKLPTVAPGNVHVYHLYVIQVDDRDGLQAHLKQAGVSTGIHYPVPVHRQPATTHIDHRCAPLPVTEAMCGRILSLPIYPELTAADQETVSAAIAQFQSK